VGTGFDDASVDASEHGEPLREIRPWCEVGWIFRDGDALAIERQGDNIRTRSARISHLREH
jgi:hypothetical protein